MAATCGSTFGGAAVTTIRYGGSRKNWSACNPTVILTGGTPATAAFQRETRTIPIVFVNVPDPVVSRIVTRLDRPSGNATGFAILETSLGGKWLELLLEIVPGLKRAAIMFNLDLGTAAPYVASFETAARSLKVAPITASVHSDVEIETAIIALRREPGGPVCCSGDRQANGFKGSMELLAQRSVVMIQGGGDFGWSATGTDDASQ